jgi:tetratricopeptide (TPR) repeat protein
VKLAGLTIALMGLAAWAESTTDPRIAACDRLLRKSPSRAYDCYVDAARLFQLTDAAVQRLEAVVARDPSDAEAYLALSRVARRAGKDEKGDYARTAARLFEQRHDLERQTTAEFGMAGTLTSAGKNDESDRLLDRIEARLRQAEHIKQDAYTDLFLLRAENAYQRADYPGALALVREAEGFLTDGSSPYLRGRLHSGLGKSLAKLRHAEEAGEHFRQAIDLMNQTGDTYLAAQFGLHLLKHAIATRSRSDQESIRDEVVRTAQRGQNHLVEAEARWILLEPGDPGYAEDVLQVITIARQYGLKRLYYGGVRARSRALVARDPAALPEAERDLDVIAAAAETSHSRYEVAATAAVRAEVAELAQLSQERIDQAWNRAFEAIEALRRSQPEPTGGARVMAQWASVYYWVSGLAAGRGGAPDANRAFEVIERLRGFALVDALLRRSAHAADGGTPLAAKREQLRQQRSTLQSSLIGGQLDERQRAEARQAIERLTAQEGALPGDPAVVEPHLPGLADVQALLADDQVLVTYQLAEGTAAKPGSSEGGGGSWAFVVTSKSAVVVPLPPRPEIQGLVSAFLGSLSNGPVPTASPAPLADAVLKPVLAKLPAGTRRLVVVPDDVLYRVPFDALLAGPEQRPPGDRLALSLAPSATAWVWWKGQKPVPGTGAVLALANPAGTTGLPAASRGAISWMEGLRLGELPRASEEARAVAALLGGESRALVGPAASEGVLKHTDLSRFGMLHFAAHAITDEEESDRSAIVLAGGEGEDGLLDVRDIEKLDLGGKVVVLSACRSATGANIRGQGPLGLTRAFLDAGAKAVVATLWPLDDAQAAEMMPSLYWQLKEGRSVGEAVAAVRREWQLRPGGEAVWANLVVVGDADVVPHPRRGLLAPLLLSAGVAVASLGLLRSGLRRRRARAGASSRDAGG